MQNQIFALLLFIFLIFSCIIREPEYEFGSLKIKFVFLLRSWIHQEALQPWALSLLCAVPWVFLGHLFPCLADSDLADMVFELDLFCHCGFTWAPRGCSPSLSPLVSPARLHIYWGGHQFFLPHSHHWLYLTFLFMKLPSLPVQWLMLVVILFRFIYLPLLFSRELLSWS